MKLQLIVSVSKEEANVLQNSLGLNEINGIAHTFQLQDEYKQTITFDAPFAWTVKYANVLSKLITFVKNAIPLFKEYNEVAMESQKYLTITE